MKSSDVGGKIKKIIIAFIIFAIIVIIAVEFVALKNNDEEDESIIDNLSAVVEVFGTETTLNSDSLSTTKQDESIIIAKNGGSFTGDALTINKEGNASNIEEAQEEGVNSAILTQSSSSVQVSNSKIITDADGANAVCTIGNESSATIINSEVTTKGENSSALVTLDDDSSIVSSNNKLTAMSNNSILLFLNGGNMSVKTTSLNTTNSNIAKISGSSVLQIESSTLIGDEEIIFFIENATASIDLTSLTVENDATVTFYVSAVDETNTSLELNLSKTELNSEIEVKENSSVTLNLLSSSTFSGKINSDNVESAKVDVDLAEDATLEITSDCYVDKFVEGDSSLQNITSNGYTIYYNPDNTENSWLDGKTVYLFDGGTIAPIS